MKESLMDTVRITQAEITDLGVKFFHWKVDQSGNARRPEQTDEGKIAHSGNMKQVWEQRRKTYLDSFEAYFVWSDTVHI